MKVTPDELDPVIHERVRLSIMATLAAAPEMSFAEVKETLALTDGNLSAHARTLEDHGYVEIEKSFVKRRPRTVLCITAKGRRAFQQYLEVLQRIVDSTTPAPAGRSKGDKA